MLFHMNLQKIIPEAKYADTEVFQELHFVGNAKLEPLLPCMETTKLKQQLWVDVTSVACTKSATTEFKGVQNARNLNEVKHKIILKVGCYCENGSNENRKANCNK